MSFFKKIFGGKKEDKTDGLEENSQEEDIILLDKVLETEEELSDTEEIYEETAEFEHNESPEQTETIEENHKEASGEPAEETKEESKGFFKKMFEGLDKTRKNIMNGVENVLSTFTVIDDELFDELEEALILADIGVETSVNIIDNLRNIAKKNKAFTVEELKKLLIKEITEILTKDETEFVLQSPTVILVIGVNGVGKTTTIGKLTNIYKQDGKKVVLAAADTFRAAAIEQLEIWANRNKVDIVKHQENSDPAAVVYDGVMAAKSRKADILICDTAGRLHNKKNLMEELRKIHKIIEREYSDAQLEVLLVLDSTTGQNALQQAKAFKEVANITGIVLTKLDGTSKGGILIAIKNELNVPIRYIGVGEGINDLQKFNAEDFSKALFGEDK